MAKPLKIDFVSDVSCPWCVVGLGGLETALERVGDLVDAEIHFQPFELNPNMPPEGQNIGLLHRKFCRCTYLNRNTVRLRFPSARIHNYKTTSAPFALVLNAIACNTWSIFNNRFATTNETVNQS